MNEAKQLERKLEELIEQLNELLAQLSEDGKEPVNNVRGMPETHIENLSVELQKLKQQRGKATDPIEKPVSSSKKTDGTMYQLT